MFVPYDLGLGGEGCGMLPQLICLCKQGLDHFFLYTHLKLLSGVTVVSMEGNYALVVWVTLVIYCG